MCLAYHCEMEDLPDDLMRLVARQMLEKEGGLKLWCKLASTCTWLWSFWLPAEPVYFLNDSLKIQGDPYELSRRCLT